MKTALPMTPLTALCVLQLAYNSSELLRILQYASLVLCRPVDDTQKLVAQAAEVDGVKWMPLEEYASNPFSATKPLYNKLVQQCVAYANGTYTGMKASSMNSGRADRFELLMHGSDAPRL